MLEGLDRVDWSQLSHAYGAATDVPALLRALASEKKKTRHDALSHLCGNIWHQGTVYQATAHAVPFLIELLDDPAVAGKAGILSLPQSLASGSSYLDVHLDLDSFRAGRETEDFQTELRRELEWVRAARGVVNAETPTYPRLLSHPKASVRVMAPYALCAGADRVEEVEPVLREQVAVEREPEVRAGRLLALAHLRRDAARQEPARDAADHLSYSAAFFRDGSEPVVVRFAAALSAAELDGPELREEALAVLRETVAGCRDDFSRVSPR